MARDRLSRGPPAHSPAPDPRPAGCLHCIVPPRAWTRGPVGGAATDLHALPPAAALGYPGPRRRVEAAPAQVPDPLPPEPAEARPHVPRGTGDLLDRPVVHERVGRAAAVHSPGPPRDPADPGPDPSPSPTRPGPQDGERGLEWGPRRSPPFG